MSSLADLKFLAPLAVQAYLASRQVDSALNALCRLALLPLSIYLSVVFARDGVFQPREERVAINFGVSSASLRKQESSRLLSYA